MMTFRRIAALAFGLAITISAEAAGQECLGISPGTRGYASFGLEGTDAVTGHAATVGLRLRDVTVQLHGRRLDQGSGSRPDFANSVDHVKTLQLQLAYPITRKVPLCVFGGLGWTGYTLQRVISLPGEPQQNMVGGYHHLRVPIGISLGKEFQLTENLRLSTFAQNAVMYEFEKYSPEQRDFNHNTLGIGMTAGLGLSYGHLMLRSTISNYKAFSDGVGLYNDFPFMSLQLGVKF